MRAVICVLAFLAVAHAIAPMDQGTVIMAPAGSVNGDTFMRVRL